MGSARSVALAFLLLAAARAGAATVDAKVMTSAGLRPQVVDGEVITTASILEAVSLRAADIQTPIVDDLKVLLSAWGALGPGLSAEPVVSGDVDVAFVEGRIFKRHLRVRLGRQSVLGGVNRIGWIDGAALDVTGPVGLSASLALGVPVGPRFSLIASGQWQLSARLQLAPNPFRWNVAASFIHLDGPLGVGRQEFGLDGRWIIAGQLTLAGAAMFSLPDKRFSEVDVGPRWQPVDEFELSAGYRRTAPDLLVPRTSIFSVFSDTNRDEVGGAVFWAPARWLSLYVDGRGLFIDDEVGVDLSARATLRRGRGGPTSLTFFGRWLRVPQNGYLQGRVSAMHRLQKFVALSAELDGFWFDQAINGRRASVTGSGSVDITFSPQWKLAVSVLGGSTPLYATRLEAFARVVWTSPVPEVSR